MAFIYSLKDINARIQRDVHAKLELVKGDGYHYFQYDDVDGNVFETHSVMVPYTKDLTLKQWLAEAREFAERMDPKVREEHAVVDGMPALIYIDGAATPAQEKTVELLKERLLHKANRYRDPQNSKHNPHEIKKFEVKHIEGSSRTYVVIELGMEGDEGTMASVFCRDYRHVSIGVRGGVTLLNAKSKRKSEGWWNVLHALTR